MPRTGCRRLCRIELVILSVAESDKFKLDRRGASPALTNLWFDSIKPGIRRKMEAS